MNSVLSSHLQLLQLKKQINRKENSTFLGWIERNWNTYKSNYTNNPIASDRLNYDVLFHTDLSREGGQSNGMDLGRVNWGNYDLVVIDESHNFRNGGAVYGEE